MKITISGYGRMGREIEKMAIEKGQQIACIVDQPEDWKTHEALISNSDVVIDFSWPDTAVNNMINCFRLGVPVVQGTTGWYDKFDVVKEACKEKNGALFTATNFSIGVNILFELNRKLASIMNRFPGYEPTIEETHHTKKLDAPSGTALTLANDLINRIERKKGWNAENTKDPDVFQVMSFREGDIPGIHVVKYDSDMDTLEIQHTAKGRKGFAQGALLAAEWLQGKSGCFDMSSLINLKE